ncbi:tRNA(Ile)-lysidine synthase [Tibeticola sediminis]|uniref:tRNA(Ile)-lysidine synthase n=2 Tax=Tibeticola sediminis TaxID=1917811 RepID=A0A3N4UYG7_9BURK|nr:tRNA(Ile)-lysidine synthase [Tibeticola sediminis]
MMNTAVDVALARFQPRLPLAVAYSGGADSTALLLACAQRWPGRVHAIHVHHGLQPAADAFEQACRAFCAQIGVPLSVGRVDARHRCGESPEDAARRARYEEIRRIAGAIRSPDAIEDIALAHHADDQVETLLIALSRGAGLPGLAAMPAVAERSGLRWHRPLLEVPAGAIREWLRCRGVRWIEDPTNADPQYLRNRLRATVLPALDASLPQFRALFARSARHAAEAQGLLEELAREDLERVGDPPALAALRLLSEPRRRNLLRFWLRTRHGTTPTAAQLSELSRQIAHCSTRGHGLRIRVGRGLAERRGDCLVWMPEES